MSYRDLAHAQVVRSQFEENSARDGTQRIVVSTTGVGTTQLVALQQFSNPFTVKPHIAYGSEITLMPDLAIYSAPACSGSVSRWERDERGFYIGCYLLVTVLVSSLTGSTPQCRALHHFSMSGIAFKDLGEDITNDLSSGTLDSRRLDF